MWKVLCCRLISTPYLSFSSKSPRIRNDKRKSWDLMVWQSRFVEISPHIFESENCVVSSRSQDEIRRDKSEWECDVVCCMSTCSAVVSTFVERMVKTLSTFSSPIHKTIIISFQVERGWNSWMSSTIKDHQSVMWIKNNKLSKWSRITFKGICVRRDKRTSSLTRRMNFSSCGFDTLIFSPLDYLTSCECWTSFRVEQWQQTQCSINLV